MSVEEYVVASAKREMACLSKFTSFPHPQGLYYGPEQYKPTVEQKLSVIHDYLKVFPYLLPKNRELCSSVLWHSDLHTDNIFVDPNDPAKIIGVIDWQSTHLSPLFLQARTPSLLGFDGDLPESFDIKLPENFDFLSREEQENAKKLRSMQSLYKLYDVACFKINHNAYLAMETRKTLGSQITGLIGSVFSDGEPYIQELLLSVQANWEPLLKGTKHEGTPCPLNYSTQTQEANRVELEKWKHSIQLMDSFMREIGAYGGWDGWVSTSEYDDMKARFHAARDRFIQRESKNEEEYYLWLNLFPFPKV